MPASMLYGAESSHVRWVSDTVILRVICGGGSLSRPMKVGTLALILIVLFAIPLPWLRKPREPLQRTFNPKNSFHGQVQVRMTDKNLGPGKVLQFHVDLDRGLIAESPSSSSDVRSKLGSSIHDCIKPVKVSAPGHGWVAVCSTPYGSKATSIKVMKLESDEKIREWPIAREWRVSGMAWSADSSSIAVLLERERYEYSPIGLLSAISGHPIPLNTFEVNVYSLQSSEELLLPPLNKDSPYGLANID